MVHTIVGANWGDEGKGKVTDLLAEKSDIVVRFQGGANAGHTIINEYGKFALHLLPSGVFHPHIVNIIGPGVALNIEALLKELESVTSRGVPTPKLLISDRAQVMMPYHVDFDDRRGGAAGQAVLWLHQVGHCALLQRQICQRWASRCASSMTRRCSVSG